MKKLLIAVSTLMAVLVVVLLFRKPEEKVVFKEVVRSVAVPTPAPVVQPKLVAENLTSVKLDRASLLRILIGGYKNGGLSESLKDFLKLSPDEEERCEAEISKVISDMKELELKNRFTVQDDRGETIVVSSYWESGGKERFDQMKEEFSGVLGNERGDIMAMMVGRNPVEIGTFGYYRTSLFLSEVDNPDDPNGAKSHSLSILQEPPQADANDRVAKEKDPEKRQRLIDEITAKAYRFSSQSSAPPITRQDWHLNYKPGGRYDHLFTGSK
jgi:hypothetical protein